MKDMKMRKHKNAPHKTEICTLIKLIKKAARLDVCEG
jgi:hypothetical protein